MKIIWFSQDDSVAMNVYKQAIIFVLVIHAVNSLPCALRAYPYGSVCVCNASYCDTLDEDDVRPKRPGEFILVSSSKGGLRFSVASGQFSVPEDSDKIVIDDYQEEQTILSSVEPIVILREKRFFDDYVSDVYRGKRALQFSNMSEKETSNTLKFVFGGLSGMAATCVVQPLDLVKTRMQISGEGGAKREYKNSFDCFVKVIKNEGPFAIYKGIGAGLLRQATYTTSRLGVYSYLNDTLKRNSMEITLAKRLGMGVIAGACGAFVGTPAEVALIRMMADGRLPLDQRRNYKNFVDALIRIGREEGLFALWSGCVPTVGRAMVVNMAQLGSYSQAKSYFAERFIMDEGIKLQFASSMTSGLITTIVSMPLDMAKTRIQNMKKIGGHLEYKGMVDVILKVAQKEGVFSLWKGITAYYARLGPHTVLTLMFLEQINNIYAKYYLGKSGGSSGF